jgi:hypothetical protein
MMKARAKPLAERKARSINTGETCLPRYGAGAAPRPRLTDIGYARASMVMRVSPFQNIRFPFFHCSISPFFHDLVRRRSRVLCMN